MQVEEQVVDLGQVLGLGREPFAYLPGIVDDEAAEASDHPDEDHLDGELEARAGHAPVGDEEEARKGHGQAGQHGQPRDDPYPAGEADDGRGHHQTDEEGGAAEPGDLDDGHAQGDLDEEGRRHLPSRISS